MGFSRSFLANCIRLQHVGVHCAPFHVLSSPHHGLLLLWLSHPSVLSQRLATYASVDSDIFTKYQLIFSLNVSVLSWLPLPSMRRISPASVLRNEVTARPTSCSVGSFLTSLMISVYIFPSVGLIISAQGCVCLVRSLNEPSSFSFFFSWVYLLPCRVFCFLVCLWWVRLYLQVARGFLLRLLLSTLNLPLLSTLGLKRRDLVSLTGCNISLATWGLHHLDTCVLYTRWYGLLLICLYG